jgi:type VI secretion system protein ImpM
MAGWHGKLPSLGDFASRRLPLEFVEVWDAWLASGLGHWRACAPQTWLADYLASPVWRFVLMPGVVPGADPAGPADTAWAGVLMPSVDRVGRYFPLTIACPLADSQRVASPALWLWLAQLEDLAVNALQDDWRIDRLEDELARLPLAPDARMPDLSGMPLAAAGAVACLGGADGHPSDAVTAVLAATVLGASLHGVAWWQAEPAGGPRRLLLSRGLPSAQAFAQLWGQPLQESE